MEKYMARDRNIQRASCCMGEICTYFPNIMYWLNMISCKRWAFALQRGNSGPGVQRGRLGLPGAGGRETAEAPRRAYAERSRWSPPQQTNATWFTESQFSVSRVSFAFAAFRPLSLSCLVQLSLVTMAQVHLTPAPNFKEALRVCIFISFQISVSRSFYFEKCLITFQINFEVSISKGKKFPL